jgi:hypothetical protein
MTTGTPPHTTRAPALDAAADRFLDDVARDMAEGILYSVVRDFRREQGPGVLSIVLRFGSGGELAAALNGAGGAETPATVAWYPAASPTPFVEAFLDRCHGCCEQAVELRVEVPCSPAGFGCPAPERQTGIALSAVSWPGQEAD